MNCIHCNTNFQYKETLLQTSCNYHSQLCQKCFMNDLFSKKLSINFINDDDIEIACFCNNNKTLYKSNNNQKLNLSILSNFLQNSNFIYKEEFVSSKCSIHNSPNNYYCRTCKKYICEKCLFNLENNSHLDHSYISKNDISSAIKKRMEELNKKNFKDFKKYMENIEKKSENEIKAKTNEEISKIKSIIETLNKTAIQRLNNSKIKISKMKSMCKIIMITAQNFFNDLDNFTTNIKNDINFFDILRLKEFKGINISYTDNDYLAKINDLITSFTNNSFLNCDFKFQKQSLKEYTKKNYHEIKNLELIDKYQIKHKLCGHSRAVFHISKIDDNTIVSCSEDTKIIIWDLKTYKPKNILSGHNGRVNNVIYAKEKNKLISCSIDNTIKIWDISTGENISTINAHKNNVTSLILLKEDKLISCGWDAKIKLWNLIDNKEILSVTTNMRTIGSLVLLSEEKFCCAAFNNILIFSLANKSLVNKLIGHSKGINCITIDKKNRLVSGADDKTIRIWNIESGKCEEIIEGHNDSVYCLIILKNGNICSGAQDRTIKIWENGKEKEVINEIYTPRCLLELNDNSIVSAGFDNIIKIWFKYEKNYLETV